MLEEKGVCTCILKSREHVLALSQTYFTGGIFTSCTPYCTILGTAGSVFSCHVVKNNGLTKD